MGLFGSSPESSSNRLELKRSELIPRLDQQLGFIGIQAIDEALDFRTGIGQFIPDISLRARRVIAYDSNESLTFRAPKYPNVIYTNGGVDRLLKTWLARFDLVWFVNALHSVPDHELPDLAFALMRTLDRKGLLFFAEPVGPGRPKTFYRDLFHPLDLKVLGSYVYDKTTIAIFAARAP